MSETAVVDKPALVPTSAAASGRVECVIEKTALDAGLTKLRGVWSDVEVNPMLKFVLFKVGEKDIVLRASNLSMTAEVKIPLYEKCTTPGAFGLIGYEIHDIVKVSDTLVSLTVNESSICSVKTKGYEWNLRGVKEFPLGDSFKVPTDPDYKPLNLQKDVLLKGLQVGESCMSDDPSAANMYGIKFHPDGSQSTDAHRIAMYKRGPGIATFTIPTPMVPTLKTLLQFGAVEMVQLRTNSSQVEVTVGSDVLLFGQMADFVNITALAKDLEVYQPKFQADRESFILGLKRSGLLGDDKTSIAVSRSGEDILFAASNGAQKLGEGLLRVTWKTPEPTFSIKLNWKVLKDVISALDGEVINFGVGTFRGNDFVRLDEEDRTLFVLSMTK